MSKTDDAPFSCVTAIKHINKIKELNTKLSHKLGIFKVLSGSESEILEKLDILSQIYYDRKDIRKNICDLENIVYPELALAEKLKLKERYETNLTNLRAAGILVKLATSGLEGIVGQDGKEYPVPTYAGILESFRNSEVRDFVNKKFDQGFTKFLLVPFASDIHELADKYRVLSKKVRENNGSMLRAGRVLEFNNCVDPLYARDDLVPGDNFLFKVRSREIGNINAQDNQIEYNIKNYDGRNKLERGGLYKSEILKDEGRGWDVILTEAPLDLPTKEKCKTVAGRRQLERGLKTNHYLSSISGDTTASRQYSGERGLTIEAVIADGIDCLTQNYQFDFTEHSKGSLLIGTFISGSIGMPPTLQWFKDFEHPYKNNDLSTVNPKIQFGYISSISIPFSKSDNK